MKSLSKILKPIQKLFYMLGLIISITLLRNTSKDILIFNESSSIFKVILKFNIFILIFTNMLLKLKISITAQI